MTLLSASGLGVSFGATTLLKDVTFTVARGEKWGIVGRNGSGKTTIVRILTGEQQPTVGVVARHPGLKWSVMEQHRAFEGAESVWDGAAMAREDLLNLEKSLHAQGEAMAVAGDQVTDQMLDKYARDQERFEREGGYEFDARVDAVLHGLGFDPADARTRALATLSGGERARVGLARQLVADADVLLLDEPTNHLDLDTTQWLEGFLRETERTVLVISHDRAFLAAFTDHTLHVEGGTATPYNGGYTHFVEQRAERRLALQRAVDKQRAVINKEEDYIRRNLAGQNSSQAKGRRKRLERLPRLSPPVTDESTMSVRFDLRERGGDQVIIAQKLRLDVEDRTLLEEFTGVVRRGDVVGLIGHNGTGKTTLLRALAADRPPTAGELRLGGSITMSWYRQDLAQVPGDKTLYDIIQAKRPLWERGAIQGHLGRFGFSGDEVMRRASTLSGGEKARVALALMMLESSNLLVFDEPTNHLDVESIEALEDAIERFEGTVLLVSHDRALLRSLVTRVWRLDDRKIHEFDGPFAEWEAIQAGEDDEAEAAPTSSARDARKGKDAESAREVQQSSKEVQAAKRQLERMKKGGR
ncbi:MAG: ABC-F family ATP-binding cassette domain-containing protein [Gemmatimonadetes bacterium]|nr:ABC-F family ATP-binding cassette domain-containing protein [Gemmatimonadota bacterium]